MKLEKRMYSKGRVTKETLKKTEGMPQKKEETWKQKGVVEKGRKARNKKEGKLQKMKKL